MRIDAVHSDNGTETLTIDADTASERVALLAIEVDARIRSAAHNGGATSLDEIRRNRAVAFAFAHPGWHTVERFADALMLTLSDASPIVEQLIATGFLIRSRGGFVRNADAFLPRTEPGKDSAR